MVRFVLKLETLAEKLLQQKSILLYCFQNKHNTHLRPSHSPLQKPCLILLNRAQIRLMLHRVLVLSRVEKKPQLFLKIFMTKKLGLEHSDLGLLELFALQSLPKKDLFILEWMIVFDVFFARKLLILVSISNVVQKSFQLKSSLF